MSYYKFLGIPINATDDDVRNGYKQSVLKAHPDKGGTAQMFKNIQDAYNILKDPIKKKKYDTQLVQLRMQKKFSKSSYCPTAITTSIKAPFAFPLMNGTQYVFETAPDQLKCRFRQGDIVQINSGKQGTTGAQLSRTGTFIGKASNGFYWKRDGDSYATLLFTEGFGGDRDVTLVNRGTSSSNTTVFNSNRTNTSGTGKTDSNLNIPNTFQSSPTKRASSTRPGAPRSYDAPDINIPRKRRSYSSSTTTGVTRPKENHTDPYRSSTPNTTTPRNGMSRGMNMASRRSSPAPSYRGNVSHEPIPNISEECKKSVAETGNTDGENTQEIRRKQIREARLKQIGDNIRRLTILETKKREEIDSAVNQYITTFFSTAETMLKTSNIRAYHLRTMLPNSNLKTFSCVGVLVKESPSSDTGDSNMSNSGRRTPKRTHSTTSNLRRTTSLYRSPSSSTMASTIGSSAPQSLNHSSSKSHNYLHPGNNNIKPYNAVDKKVSLTARPTIATFSAKYDMKESPSFSRHSERLYTSIRRNIPIKSDSTKMKSSHISSRNSENINDTASVASSTATMRSKRSAVSFIGSRGREGRSVPVTHSSLNFPNSFRDSRQRSMDSQKHISPLSKNDGSECGSRSTSVSRSNASPMHSTPRNISKQAISATFQKGLNSSRNTLSTRILEQIHSKEILIAMPKDEDTNSRADQEDVVEVVSAQSLIAASLQNDRSKSVEPPVLARRPKPQTQEASSTPLSQASGDTPSSRGSVMWCSTRSENIAPIENESSNLNTTQHRTSKPLSFGLPKAMASSTPRCKGVSFVLDEDKRKVQQEVPSTSVQRETDDQSIKSCGVEEIKNIKPVTDTRNIDDDICKENGEDGEEEVFINDRADIKSPTIPISTESAQFLKNFYLQKNGGRKGAKKSDLIDMETESNDIVLQPLDESNGSVENDDIIPFAESIATSTSGGSNAYNSSGTPTTRHTVNIRSPLTSPIGGSPSYGLGTPRMGSLFPNSSVAGASPTKSPVSILKNASVSYTQTPLRSRSGPAAPPPIVTLRKAVSVA
eukprot:Tbor_TRINITY_DN5262_c0_g1::TRINITY_DN5262_c0_g1_i1::g.16388::m.16388